MGFPKSSDEVLVFTRGTVGGPLRKVIALAKLFTQDFDNLLGGAIVFGKHQVRHFGAAGDDH